MAKVRHVVAGHALEVLSSAPPAVALDPRPVRLIGLRLGRCGDHAMNLIRYFNFTVTKEIQRAMGRVTDEIEIRERGERIRSASVLERLICLERRRRRVLSRRRAQAIGA